MRHRCDPGARVGASHQKQRRFGGGQKNAIGADVPAKLRKRAINGAVFHEKRV
jgi:hypothetical protein